MLSRLGAHAVGMSTVPEALVARAAGVPVLGISLISNAAAGFASEPLAHEDVIAAGEAAALTFARLIRGIVPRIAAAVAARA
jgi:purine-nucleoside phosphorylase